MRTREQVRDALVRESLGVAQDNLCRARAAARGHDENEPWGRSGKTLAQIINEYESSVKELENAL